jgi:hypothetical protein
VRLSLAREVLKQLLEAAPQLLGEVHVEGLWVVAAPPRLSASTGIPVWTVRRDGCESAGRPRVSDRVDLAAIGGCDAGTDGALGQRAHVGLGMDHNSPRDMHSTAQRNHDALNAGYESWPY